MRPILSPKFFLASMLALPVCASAQNTTGEPAAPAPATPAPTPSIAAPAAPEPGAVSEAALPGHLAEETRTATFDVIAIDAEKRMITLREQGDEPQTYRVSDEVRNLDQVKAGDRVSVSYRDSTSIQVLPPGEIGNQDAASIQRSQPGEKPGGVATRARSITVTVSSIFPDAKEFLTRNSQGQLRTWKVKDAKDLEKFKSGDRLQLTSVSSVAVSVAPAPPAAEATPAAAKAEGTPPAAEPAKPAEPAKAAEPTK